MSLGAELKRKRLELQWTQRETAVHFGVGKDSYQSWEWNEYVPHVHNRKKIVEFLGYNYWDDGTGSLANRVLLYRIEHGLTQYQLAQRLGVSDSTVERIEIGFEHISDSLVDRKWRWYYKSQGVYL